MGHFRGISGLGLQGDEAGGLEGRSENFASQRRFIEFYGDTWEDDTKQQFRCTCHQMNESQRSNQAVQWKPDQSFLPFCQIVAAGN